jgi:hypothetical protein
MHGLSLVLESENEAKKKTTMFNERRRTCTYVVVQWIKQCIMEAKEMARLTCRGDDEL